MKKINIKYMRYHYWGEKEIEYVLIKSVSLKIDFKTYKFLYREIRDNIFDLIFPVKNNAS